MSSRQGYSVKFENESLNGGSVYMYQTNPGLMLNNARAESAKSLVWFTYGTNPGTKAEFKWNIDYSMLWSATQELVEGVVVTASQMLPCTLQDNNEVTFTRNDNGFLLKDQRRGEGGRICFLQDEKIPHRAASIGIGMSGAGTFAVEAQPNLRVSFKPTPTYWIAFNLRSVQQGAVLVSQGTAAQQITFPPNNYTCKAVLDKQNAWELDFS